MASSQTRRHCILFKFLSFTYIKKLYWFSYNLYICFTYKVFANISNRTKQSHAEHLLIFSPKSQDNLFIQEIEFGYPSLVPTLLYFLNLKQTKKLTGSSCCLKDSSMDHQTVCSVLRDTEVRYLKPTCWPIWPSKRILV